MRGPGELRATVGLHTPRWGLCQNQHEQAEQMLFLLLPNYAFFLLFNSYRVHPFILFFTLKLLPMIILHVNPPSDVEFFFFLNMHGSYPIIMQLETNTINLFILVFISKRRKTNLGSNKGSFHFQLSVWHQYTHSEWMTVILYNDICLQAWTNC